MKSKGKAMTISQAVAILRTQGGGSLEPYAAALAEQMRVSVEDVLAEMRRQGEGPAKSAETVAQERMRQDAAYSRTAAGREWNHEE